MSEPAAPTPTAVAVRAYAYAATFRVKDLPPLFVGAETRVSLDEAYARWPDGSAAVCFDFGAIVFFGVSDERQAEVASRVAKLAGDEPHPPLTEEFHVELRPGAPSEVRFDKVIVAELSEAVISLVGLLLAQSAAMDYYEEDVAEILAETGKITRDLATHGRVRGSVRDVVKFIGRCILTKNGIIETLALFDKPELTWEQEAYDRLFVRLRETLEINDRFRALEYKLRMIQETLELFADLTRQRHSLLLEWGVLVLIIIEVGVMVWQVWVARGGHP